MMRAETENGGSHPFWLTLQLVFLLCSICVVPSTTQGDKITCSVPSVYPFQDTVLMCHFPEDVLVSMKDFTVYYYVTHDSPEAVLDCWWLQGHLDCYTRSGFKYDKRVGRNLNLTFSEVTRAHGGIYACQVAGYGSSSLETCELNLKIGEDNTCNISRERSDSQASLTCFFNENIHKTQRDFAVYKHNGQEKQSVAKCLWNNGLQKCQTEEGYQYNMEVFSYLKMTIPKPKQAETQTYSCWHYGSEADRVQTCSIDGTVSAEEGNYKTVVVVFVVVPGVLTLSLLLWFILYKSRRRLRRLSFGDREMHAMIRLKKKSKKVIETFEKFLLENASEMYPNMLEGCYFVPPVYFNKVRYTTKSVVGHVVYIADLPDDSDVRHDRAMKHILYCLHHIAEHGQETMFVLTQFNYNDYLNNPGKEYKNHHLPFLNSLKNKNNDRHIGCFDILIIHRQYGVVIGVVKSLSDKDDCSQEGERRTDDQLAKDISEGIEQLMEADRVIQHFMSDKQQPPTVRLTLMLPNVARDTLQRALNNHADVAQNLCECMKTIELPTGLCLCADDVPNALPYWDVDPTVMSPLKKWWGHLMSSSVDAPVMSDELYQTMIARFCGVATSSSSDILRGSNMNQLPKTLDQSVSLIGDLFERQTLYPGMVELLDRPRVLLIGPPATGKSRMLALVGRKWISAGHIMYIINTSSDCGAATKQLKMLMQQSPSHRSRSAKDKIIPFSCSIEDDEKIDVAIKTLRDDASARKIPIFAVLDELGHDLTISRQGTAFLQKLLQLPDLHLWAATCRSDILPDGCCDGKMLTETLSCPPSVVREAQQYVIPGMAQYTSSNRQSPTDGLPVKNIYHQCQGHQQKEPRDCKACGGAVVQFLRACLRNAVSAACEATANGNPTNDQETWRQPPAVQWKDILILFESDFTENVALLKCLLESGIPVQIISSLNQEKSDNNTVFAAKAGFLCGLKRKVVVYVEASINRSDDSAKWTRLRGITSCTSQLVVVRMS